MFKSLFKKNKTKTMKSKFISARSIVHLKTGNVTRVGYLKNGSILRININCHGSIDYSLENANEKGSWSHRDLIPDEYINMFLFIGGVRATCKISQTEDLLQYHLDLNSL